MHERDSIDKLTIPPDNIMSVVPQGPSHVMSLE